MASQSVHVHLSINTERKWAAGIVTWLRATRSGVWIPAGGTIFSPQPPDQLCGLPSLIFSGYLGIFPWCRADKTWSWPFPSNLTQRLKMSAATPLCPRPCLHGVERGFYSFLSDINLDIPVFSIRNTIQNHPFMGRPGLTCLWAGQMCKFDEAVPWYYDPLWAYLVSAPATGGWGVFVER